MVLDKIGLMHDSKAPDDSLYVAWCLATVIIEAHS